MKIPPEVDRLRCLKLRKLSKSGKGSFNLADHKFCIKMFKKYPEWYNETQEEIFNDTVPFGSCAKYKK